MYSHKKNYLQNVICFACLILSILTLFYSDTNAFQIDIQNILSLHKKQKKIRVIIEIESKQKQNDSNNSLDTINNATRKIVIQALKKMPLQIVKTFKYSPALAVEVDRSKLADLAGKAFIKNIYADTLSVPTLDQSVPFVGAVQSWQLGYAGQGQLIAIIDTGVDAEHEFFSGKIISEACFSSQSDSYNSQSICPEGLESSEGKNSAKPCSLDIKGCDHGTHVAGIAAGQNNQFSGVARDAGIMAIQVFSTFYDSSDNDNICKRMGRRSPCIMSFASDQIEALEYIYSQRNQWKIAAVNMSLSGGKPYAKPCDDDPRKSIIAKLYSAGIAVIASAGNNGYVKAIGAPACISEAISVGAVDNHDTIQPFSNSSDQLDFFAPGFAINSSIPGQQFCRMSGTSMAAPHVAGAWAIMRSKYPHASISEISDLLKSTGSILTDVRNNIKVSRIQVDFAASELQVLLPDKTINDKVDQKTWCYYRIPQPANECQYTVKMHDLSDDADLYLRQNDLPTLQNWDFRPYKGLRQTETIIFHAKKSSLWYVGIYGYQSASFKISLEYIPVHQLKIGDSDYGFLDQGEWRYYKIDFALPDQKIQVRLDGIKGDMDLFSQKSVLPDEKNFVGRSNKNGQTPEILKMQSSGSQTSMYIGVLGYQKGGYMICVEPFNPYP